MTRCIHCTWCVWFAVEIAGMPNLGIFNWGSNSEIGTYVKNVFLSEISGNVIDLCPVGIITLKKF
jgi:NADH-quinone oxidoreductase subunit G